MPSAPRRIDAISILIEGSPGTGKSVVAINLLFDLLVAGCVGKRMSRNAASRTSMKRSARQVTANRLRSLFAGSGSFVEAPKVSNDFLVVGKAHRLNEKSGLYGNLGDHQVKENHGFVDLFDLLRRRGPARHV